MFLSGLNKGPVPISFVQVLEHSLKLEQNTQAWCNNCAKYQQHVGPLAWLSAPLAQCFISAFTVLTHSHTMTPFDAPGKQAF